MRIVNSITELIGNTPLVKLNDLIKGLKAGIAVKLEFSNSGNSVKGRIAESTIEAAEKVGKIHKNAVIVEATSDNTGIGLAVVCAAHSYKLAITMPENMSKERRTLLRAFGAELILTLAAEGIGGAIAKTQTLVDRYLDTYFIPRRFGNEANPQVRRETTAEEIWHNTGGKVDILVTSIDTGSTVIGAGEVLKQRNPAVRIVAIKPVASPVLSGGEKGPHPIQGLGAGFAPSILNTKTYDSITQTPNEAAFETAHITAEKEDTLVDIPSGAIVRSASQLARQPGNRGKLIVVLIPSYGKCYLSTPLFADLM